MKELRVNAIKNGTVIDHIPPSQLFRIMHLLEPEEHRSEILIGNNLKSRKLGKKGVIKLSNIILTSAAIDKVALLAHGATIVTIKNYEVSAKQPISMPREVVNIVECFNPNCITNAESATTRFIVLRRKPLRLQCHYCEKAMDEHQLSFRKY